MVLEDLFNLFFIYIHTLKLMLDAECF